MNQIFYIILSIFVLIAFIISIISIININQVGKLILKKPNDKKMVFYYRIYPNADDSTITVKPNTSFISPQYSNQNFNIDSNFYPNNIVDNLGIITIPDDGIYRFYITIRAIDGNQINGISFYVNDKKFENNLASTMFLPIDSTDPSRRTGSFMFTKFFNKNERFYFGPFCSSNNCDDEINNIQIKYVEISGEKIN